MMDAVVDWFNAVYYGADNHGFESPSTQLATKILSV